MKLLKLWILAAILIFSGTTSFALCSDCNDNRYEQGDQAFFIPEAPDYNDATMWTVVDDDAEGKGADVFYVVSTWEEDWKDANGRTCHYADVWNATHREHMSIEIDKVAAYMSPGNRFYAPYYRHTTIDAWLTQNEDTINRRIELSMDDVRAAFDHFQAQRDQSRPLIIVGFSQGGRAMVELLKYISDETYSQLVAAYVLGYKVTHADMAQCSHIRPAEGETDTGVTICYNTVKDVKYAKPIIAGSDICINPVNWRTDDVPATLHYTQLLEDETHELDIAVTVSPEHHVLVVNGYDGAEYPPYKDLINVGDIHSCEPWLYSECLKKNFAVRTKEWRYKTNLCITANAQDQRFENPPKEARPYVWWHWINGNTSKDGIRKDLEWMDRIGIVGFHQFDAGGSMMQGLPPVVPQTPYLSDAWKENFAYAIALADSLGMEVGIASAPGWSSTGGPWVQPEDAMKKLTWRTLEMNGNGKSQTLKLPEPYKTIGRFQNVSAGIYAPLFERIPQWYQDIAVVAVRVPEAEKSMQELGATITSSGGNFTVEQLTNGDINDGSELALNKEGTHAWIQYNFPKAVTIRSFTLVGGQVQGQFESDRIYDNTLLCSQDGKTWTEVIRVSSSNLAQITVDIPETTAKYFRLTVINPKPDYSLIYYGAQVVIPTGTAIHEWKLNTVYKVNHAEEKAGFATPGDLLQLPTPTTDAAVQETIDLTDKVKDGVLTWTAPAGKWRIYRFGTSLTGKQNHPAPPEATGLEVDKLDADAWNRYFHTYLDMYKEASGGLLGARGIQYLMIDSYEAEQMTWTPKMEQAFKTARGYDLRTWLPALTGEIISSSEATENFLFDWRETIGELFAANYDRVNGILQEYGMKGRYTESHESARAFVGDGMDPKRTATVPMAAIWTADATESVAYQADIRESASTAHIYGQNIVAGESFTTNGMLGGAYSWYPGNLKEVADVALMSGLNRFFIHESTHQPSDDFRPGLGLLIFGQWFSRHETWAEYAKYWMDYLARSCYYLQAGRNVADVLWFYGEDTNIASAYGKALPDVPDTYNYDFCSPHALLNRISAKDYKVIALGEHAQNMSIEVLRKLHQLVSEGVFLIGKEPVKMAGRGDDITEFERLKTDIWHTNRPNVWTGNVAEGLKRSGVAPDFLSSVSGIRFVHRVDGDRNIYWVRNFSGKEVDTDIVLRDAKGTLTVMNPVNGKPVFGALKDGRLHLGADDALFIVADPAAKPLTEPTSLKSVGKVALDGPWTVSFEGQDAPEGIRTWQTLSSLTESDEAAVKYFSGTATYQNTFTLPKKNLPAGLCIDLGEVGQMADVFINGEHVDFLWKAPYKVNYEGRLKPGKNTIEVKVVNTWVNRLIGDGQPDVEGHSFTPVAFYGVKSLTQNMGPVIPSGLMGPVHLEILR